MKSFSFFLAASIVFCSCIGAPPLPPNPNNPSGSDSSRGAASTNGFPVNTRYGRPLVFFAQVDKAGEYFRRMFIDSASFAQMRRHASSRIDSVPIGALLVMETWGSETSQSTVFIRQKTLRGWENAAFAPSIPNFTLGTISGCNSCHEAARITDNTFTLPLLRRVASGGAIQRIECNQGPTTPCDLSVYQGR